MPPHWAFLPPFSGNSPALPALHPLASWRCPFPTAALYFRPKLVDSKPVTCIINWDFKDLVKGQNSKGTVYYSMYFCMLSFIRDQDLHTFILRHPFSSPSN